MIVLSQFAPTNKKITLYFEIEELFSKLLQVLGEGAKGFDAIK
tara:strand:+ start:119 stop:247 length:129 start_codon:yes stop_codon:yes gene_type:complete